MGVPPSPLARFWVSDVGALSDKRSVCLLPILVLLLPSQHVRFGVYLPQRPGQSQKVLRSFGFRAEG